MDNKNSMSRAERLRREKVTRYSIRKYSFGAASVAVAALFMFLGNGAVSANELSKQDTPSVEAPAPASEDKPISAESTPVAQPITEESTAKAEEAVTPALNKKQLENYISEVKSKLAAGKYANKTEESLALLTGELTSAESILASATTQDELTKAYNKLVMTVNSGLKNKPTEKKETPAVDTTNGKETVGKKAENTEKKSDSNSIENTGSHDSRNGKALDKDNVFRTEATATTHEATTNKVGNISYTMEFSDDAKKEIYLYNEEDADISIDVNSTAGKITLAMVRGASGQYLNRRSIYTSPEREELDGFGWTYYSTLEPTEGPIKLRITGKPNDTFKKLSSYTKQENQNAVLGERYLNIVDEAGGKIEKGNGSEAYGYFKMVVKSQTYKYQPKELTNTDKVLVANPKQLTEADLAGIKNALKVEYSKTSTDARLTSLKGTEVADTNTVVDTVTDSGSDLVVTYKDGSTDTIPKGTLIKSGDAPTVNMPQPASGGPRERSILSTDKTITGTGTPGSKITIQVENAENGKLLKEITDIPVDASGNWTATLENGLNSNVPVGGNAKAQNFFAPKNPVKVFETKDGIETASTNTYVSIGASKVLPSEASKDKASVVAGSKEVVLEVPHDAGISYFWYHDKETGKEVQIDIQRDKEVAENLGIKVAAKDVDKVAIKSVTKGEFYNTITLEMKKNIKEGVVKIISHNNDGTHSSKAGKVSTPVTNEKPVVASVSGEDTTTVLTNSRLNLLSLVKVTDHEDDKDATLGDKGHARVISVDGNTSAREVDTSEAGEHTVVYKTVDSQGKESDEYIHKVIVRENLAPTVELPYSNPDKRQIYIYTGEKTDLTFKASDDATVKDLYLRNKGLDERDNASGYGFTIGKVTDSAVASGDGMVSADKRTATIKMTGVTNLKAPNKWTSFIEAKDNDGVKSMPANEAYNVENDYALRRRKLGYVEFIVKSQTDKYDIKAPTEKVAVTDPANVTEDELAKIKEKLQIEYNQNNDDANISKDAPVTDKDAKIASVTKDDRGNLVVTYTDDSKDTRPLSEFVTLDKQPAIDAVTTEADNKIKAITDNANLSQAEKDKAIAKVNEDKTAALGKIDEATNKTAVDGAKTDGTDAVAKVNPVAKEKAKQAVTDALKAKNDALDAREDLTQKEKEDAKAAAKVEADKAIAKINEQPDTAPTPAEATTAQTAVDTGKTDGTDAIAKINPIGKQAALDKIDEALKAKEKEIDDRTDLTDEEKKEVKDKAKKIADTKKAEINAKKNNADTEAEAGTIQGEINTAGTDGADAITALIKDPAKKPEANTAVTNAAEAKKQSIQDDTTLSPEAKKKLQDEVDEIKKASEEAINGAKKNANVDQVKKAAVTAIAAINSARLPGNKLVAKNPTNLDSDEQEKLKKAIEAVNPGATVTVNQDGSASVRLPNGKTETLKQVDLTKDASALETTGGGNNINRPTDKVIVNNPDQLTAEDKEKIKKAVREVNPNAVVSIDDAGTVTVSTPDGHTAGFPAKELVRTLADAAKDGSGNAGILKPADKVVGNATDPADQAKATEKLKKLNGADATVKYDAEGNATVVLKDGTIATIPAADLFKTPEDTQKVNGGDDINKPNAQTVVADMATLSPEERTKVKDAIKAKVEAVNPGAVVVVDDKGNAIVTTPEGKTAVIDADDLIKKPNETSTAKAGNNINNPADKVQVADKAELTEPELARIKAAVEAVNPGATVVVDDKGNATVTTPEGRTATIPVPDLVKTSSDKENVSGGNQVNTPADRVVVENPTALNDTDKEKIKAEILKVNPGAEVVFDTNGNATVTNKDGVVATIPATDLVKAKTELADPTKQDAVNKPADKVVVDPELVDNADATLPQTAKDAIKAAVEAVNPDSTVVVDDKGNATVTTPEGKTVVIPKADLVRKEADKETAKAGNNINKPADRVLVTDPTNIDEAAKKAIEEKVKAVNPDATVVVDANGNATVTTPDGKTATIPVADLVKTAADAENTKAGNNVNKPADKVTANKDNLQQADKDKIKEAILKVNPEGTKVFVDDKGNATVSTPDGKTATIPVEDLVKTPTAKDEVNGGNKVNTPADKVVVANPAELTTEDKEKIAEKIKAVNPDAKVVFDEKGNATVTTKDGAVATIPASDLVKTNNDLTDPAKQDAVKKPADKTLVKNPAKLTDTEKDAIKAAVAKVNPENTTVVVDEKGNATVTTPDGKTEVIPASDLVKIAKEAEGANAGNNINKPADKVSATPADLTGDKKDEVKAKIQKAVESVNPGATVFVDEKGNATVTTPDGKTATIPVEDLLKDPAAKETPLAGNKVNTPAEKALVDPAVLNDPTATLPKDVKDAIQKAVESVNPGATVVVDDKGNATVTVTNPDGTKTTATIPASDLVKSNAKEDLENAAKQDAIKKPIDQTVVADKDALTGPEKEAIKAKVQEVNPGATVVVDEKGNATVTTPEGKTAVIPADDLVKTADEVLTDPKAGNVINKPADRELVADKEHLTPEDIKAIKDRVAAVNPGSTVFVDDKGNATVTTKDGQTATIPVNDLVKTEADKNTANAGNKVNTPADKVLVKDPAKLTAKEVEEIEKKIKEVNPDAEVVFDDKGNATVKTKEGNIATIPVSDLVKPKADLLDPAKQDAVKKPADKTLVKNPDSLTLEEKKEIEAKVRAVNPPADGTTVFVDDKGNATVTTKDGKTVVIPKDDLVKTEAETANEKAGNNINKPADKTVVANPEALSSEEKKAIEAKVKAVNPAAKAVFVDDKGNATVTLKDGKSATIPATDLVKSPEDAIKPNAGNKVNTPADKVVVKDPDTLTDADQEAITKKIQEVNPEAKVVFDKFGNATVTTKDGAVATIPAKDLVKTESDAAKPEAGNNVNKPADKAVVANPEQLTDAEKEAVKKAVEAVNPGSTVVVDDKGNATVTTKDGKTAVIPAADLTKTEAQAKEPNAGNDVVKPADKTVVANPEQLTDAEKEAVKKAVEAVNPGAEVVVDDKGNATVTVNGKTAVISAADLTKSAEDAAKPNAGNDVNTPADKTVVANPDSLTQDEKDAIAAKVKAVNPGAEVVVDDKGNATVTVNGKTAVIPAADLTKSAEDAAKPNAGNNVVKPADKTLVKDSTKLTDDEKQAITDKLTALNPEAKVVVDDKGNATVTPKDGKPVVIPAADLTKTEAQAKEPKAGNDIVKPADKTVVANPDSLTQDEKDAIAAKVKAVNPGSTVVVDDKGNATVTLENGKTAVIPAADLTKNADAENAPKAGNEIVKPASKTKVANPDSLTQDEKDAIVAKVKAVNPGSTVVVDEKGNATVTLENGKTAVIPASDLTKSEKDVNDGKAKDNAVTPASKTKVANPEQLTDAEKKAIEDKVKAANPGATVVVDDKGNATVVKDGNVSVIPSTDLVKVEDDANKPNGGNDANTPAAKTVVANPDSLTTDEQDEIIAKVQAVNPGSTVVVDDKGNATVTKADGTVLNIPALDLVIPAEKLADEATNAKVKTPAIRTLVGDKENLTDAEKEAVKKAIEAVNPGATVVVDNKGNATVTMPDGSTATISKEQLVKDKEAVSKSKHGGDNLDIDLSKVEVTDLANITPEEKAKFQFMMLGAINSKDAFNLDEFTKETDEQGNTVYTSKDSKVKIIIDKDGNMKVTKDGKTDLAVNIDKAGNVTIVTKDGKVLAISRDDAFKQRPYVPQYDGNAGNTDAKVDKSKLESEIHNLDSLIASQLDKLDVAQAKEAQTLLAEAKDVFANAKASQAEVDAMVKRIEDFMAKVASAINHATPANDQDAQTPTTTQAAANASQTASAQANTRTVAKELPNTGTADSTVAMVAAAASALLGLGLAGRRRKEDEEA
ncbi:LPXTG-motif cell wall anchor domain protein [Streptococcus mitis]|uniref:LPXTG-motif cell wall anchor domain protein n=1 Tax=Streptococcus mitis TaxID=28037 RepID=A0A081Q9S5_STRMT|nr:YSIRK signal domain/LPXTG anchor domain surface protein [Streptococcus mitis]KEQ39698.1 LPXTG-motif cell wall anchor domain protein [Streptococcus mitis]